jgi:hypothetical protein
MTKKVITRSSSFNINRLNMKSIEFYVVVKVHTMLSKSISNDIIFTILLE